MASRPANSRNISIDVRRVSGSSAALSSSINWIARRVQINCASSCARFVSCSTNARGTGQFDDATAGS